MKKIAIFQTIMIIVEIILLVISIITYRYIYKFEVGKQNYLEISDKFSKDNEKPTFKIGKIILYSSANVVDNSEEQELQDIDISQFTDMELFIDNKIKVKELTAENTINEMYIDDIKIKSNSKYGKQRFNYKNPNNCGKYVDFQNYKDDGILFKIINTNSKNISANYDENIFFTDCSNPISLGYINKDLLTNCTVNDTGSITFDGSILKSANVDLKEMETSISFTIHLKNNYNEEFMCNVNVDNFLKEDSENGKTIYDGYVMKVINVPEDKLNFLKIPNIK